SVCPCSKAISDYGAHNQRGFITMAVRCADGAEEAGLVWIEELIEVAEGCASTPVYPVLKRPDERYVTMAGFDNPVFVEDMAPGGPEAVPALDLYGGEHWQVARSLPAHGVEGGREVKLWVSSAGYGLVPAEAPLRPYAATFSSAQADSVLRPGAPMSDLTVWW